jgi:hypothetical protein
MSAQSEHNAWIRTLTAHKYVDRHCDDCGEGIEETYYTNAEGKSVHISCETNGHYYSDGSAHCDACHDGGK